MESCGGFGTFHSDRPLALGCGDLLTQRAAFLLAPLHDPDQPQQREASEDEHQDRPNTRADGVQVRQQAARERHPATAQPQ